MTDTAHGAVAARRRLVLYGRAGCHLCDTMRTCLVPLGVELDFDVEAVDVGWEGELARRYGDLVPVLFMEGEEICRYVLDEARLRARFG